MTFCYSQNILQAGNSTVNLDELRRFLLDTQPTLCTNHFIKAIIIDGETVYTYDWYSLFAIAEKAGYVHDFLLTRLLSKPKE